MRAVISWGGPLDADRKEHTELAIGCQVDPYYTDDLVTLYHADWREARRADLPTSEVDLLLTDVPYNISKEHKEGGLRRLDYGDWDEGFDVLAFFDRAMVLAAPRSVYVWCHELQLSGLLQGLRDHDYLDRPLVWLKPNPTVMNGRRTWLPGVEMCAFGKRKRSLFRENCHPGWWVRPPDHVRLHPNQKPLRIIGDQIRASTVAGELVFDPFAGSGTTLVAAKALGRQAIGYELIEEHCDVIARRLEQEQLELEDLEEPVSQVGMF